VVSYRCHRCLNTRSCRYRDEATPREVTALAGRCIRRIAGGWRHTLATDDQGNLWAWGWNKVPKISMYQETKGTLGAKACVACVQTYS
jgi:alpha-tubulin suppressor-like RCC1 family protein